MKQILFLILLSPLFSHAQEILPRFVNDTLYTSGGYKIYKGSVLKLGKGSVKNGKKFQFIKYADAGVHLSGYDYNNTTITVRKLYDYKMSGLGNRYISVVGTMTYKDGSTTRIDVDINFDRAINNSDGLPGEILVPEEFRIAKNPLPVNELERLFKLYQEGGLTREEYEALKKKLIEKN